jgi:hypothetical protein
MKTSATAASKSINNLLERAGLTGFNRMIAGVRQVDD